MARLPQSQMESPLGGSATLGLVGPIAWLHRTHSSPCSFPLFCRRFHRLAWSLHARSLDASFGTCWSRRSHIVCCLCRGTPWGQRADGWGCRRGCCRRGRCDDYVGLSSRLWSEPICAQTTPHGIVWDQIWSQTQATPKIHNSYSDPL